MHPVITVKPLVSDLWETEGYAETLGLDGTAELTFKMLIKIKGRAPSRTRQFCTTFLKMIPQRRWMEDNFAPAGLFPHEEKEIYTGVRRDESHARLFTPFRAWDDFFICWLNNPLADWTKKMCFDYVTAHGQEYNPLYRLGFSRVGCAPCINSGKDDILLWLQRYPEMIDKVRDYEQNSGVTFFSPCVPGMDMNFIDEVIAWAQTDRGGRQANMFKVLNEHPGCESKYGLCE